MATCIRNGVRYKRHQYRHISQAARRCAGCGTVETAKKRPVNGLNRRARRRAIRKRIPA